MPDALTVSTFEVRKDNWGDTRVANDSLDTVLAENDVLLKVDRLALTANNISYAAAGDSLGYWRFFPAASGWGRIPAMGWGEVVDSAHPNIAAGERVWGFFPMSTHLKIRAGNVDAAKIHDMSEHRADLAPVYSQFDRAAANPFYDIAREDQDSLLRGLFVTSWLVEDFLTVNEAFGADACLVTSASSKTSIALAHSLRQRGKLESCGITSQRNVEFCESLDCYDTVVTYDEIASLDTSQAAVLVDMAGSAKVLSDLHHHYGDNMRHSCRIGATHINEMGPVDGLPGATPEFFFAPTHIKVRSGELGATQFMKRMGIAYAAFRQSSDSWLKVERHVGEQAVSSAFQQVLAGKADPAIGHIISMWPERDA